MRAKWLQSVAKSFDRFLIIQDLKKARQIKIILSRPSVHPRSIVEHFLFLTVWLFIPIQEVLKMAKADKQSDAEEGKATPQQQKQVNMSGMVTPKKDAKATSVSPAKTEPMSPQTVTIDAQDRSR